MRISTIFRAAGASAICVALAGSAAFAPARETAVGQRSARIMFLVTAEPQNYQADQTISRFAKTLHERRGHECTVVQGEGPLEGLRFPGLEALDRADLLVIFFRRSGLSPEQLGIIRRHLGAGKPLVGIRTANHAFSVNGDPAAGHEKWWEFAPEVLGCENRGYGKEADGVDVAVVPGADRHPILEGVEPLSWHSQGALYRVKPLIDDDAAVLLTGGSGPFTDEPLAWTRMAGKSRVFYTSLGYPSDFDLPQYRRLLENGIEWALDTDFRR